MSFILSSGQWSLLTRPPVSGRPYKTNAKAPSTLPARASYALRFYSTVLSLNLSTPFVSFVSPAVFSFSHLQKRVAISCFVAVTNCQRSSAMSYELNQSAECPGSPGRRKTIHCAYFRSTAFLSAKPQKPASGAAERAGTRRRLLATL